MNYKKTIAIILLTAFSFTAAMEQSVAVSENQIPTLKELALKKIFEYPRAHFNYIASLPKASSATDKHSEKVAISEVVLNCLHNTKVGAAIKATILHRTFIPYLRI